MNRGNYKREEQTLKKTPEKKERKKHWAAICIFNYFFSSVIPASPT